MILIFGGTTEGKLVAQALEAAQLGYIYSTKTSIDFCSQSYGIYRYGAFSEESLVDFCLSKSIRIIIHASHPFAVELHQTIENGAYRLSIPVVRYERSFPEKISNDLVKYFKSFDEALEYLIQSNVPNLLALTGVQTIDRLQSYWMSHPTIFRILPRQSSLSIADQAGFPRENLLLQMPGIIVDDEVEIIKAHDIKCVLTKESGDSGFLTVKIEAALRCKIPILIIERPDIPSSFICVSSIEELMQMLKLSQLR